MAVLRPLAVAVGLVDAPGGRKLHEGYIPIIGGLASIYGSLLGAALLTMLPEMLRAFQDYDIIVYGLLLIIMTMYLPGGLVKIVPNLFAAIRSRLKRSPAANA